MSTRQRQVRVAWPTPDDRRVEAIESETHEGTVRSDGTINIPGALYLVLADFALRYPAGTPITIRLEATVPAEPAEVALSARLAGGEEVWVDGRD